MAGTRSTIPPSAVSETNTARSSDFSNHNPSSVLSAAGLEASNHHQNDIEIIAKKTQSQLTTNNNNNNQHFAVPVAPTSNYKKYSSNIVDDDDHHDALIGGKTLDDELAEHLAAKKRRGTYKAKYLIWLAGIIFGACGTCLVCSQDAGIADYYYYSPLNYVARAPANSSAFSIVVNRKGVILHENLDDATFTLYMDGYICANGNCTSVFDHECVECCDEMHTTLVEFRGLSILSGSVELLFCFLMFGVLFVRFVAQLGKELVGAHAAKTSVFQKIDNWIQGVMQSSRTVCVLFTGTSVLMMGLIAASIYLIYVNYTVLHYPLCENQPQSYPFNYSLASLNNHYSAGRGTHLVLIGSVGALAVAVMFFVWLVMYIFCAIKEMSEDEDAGFDDHLLDLSNIDDLLNTDEYKNDPKYRQYVEEVKKKVQSSDLKAHQEQREELRRRARDARKYSQISNKTNNNNNHENSSISMKSAQNLLSRIRGLSSASNANSHNQQQTQKPNNQTDDTAPPESSKPILSPANLERVNKGGLALLDNGYFEQRYGKGPASSMMHDSNGSTAASFHPTNYSSKVSAPPALKQQVAPSFAPHSAQNTENNFNANDSMSTNATTMIVKKKKLVTVRKAIRKKSNPSNNNNNNNNKDDDNEQGEDEDGADDDNQNDESSPKHLRDTQPPTK